MPWREASGIWHIPYEGGVLVTTELPESIGYAGYCWTRNAKWNAE